MVERIKVLTAVALGCAAMGLSACHPAGNSAGDKMTRGANQIGQGIKQAGSDAGQTLSDTAITTKIKSKLAATQGLTTFEIHVKTENGVVTLTGSVDTAEQRDLAGKTASGTDGVKGVDNQLVVASD